MENQLVTIGLKGLSMPGHFEMGFSLENIISLCLIFSSIFLNMKQNFIIYEVAKQHPPSLRSPTG